MSTAKCATKHPQTSRLKLLLTLSRRDANITHCPAVHSTLRPCVFGLNSLHPPLTLLNKPAARRVRISVAGENALTGQCTPFEVLPTAPCRGGGVVWVVWVGGARPEAPLFLGL